MWMKIKDDEKCMLINLNNVCRVQLLGDYSFDVDHTADYTSSFIFSSIEERDKTFQDIMEMIKKNYE